MWPDFWLLHVYSVSWKSQDTLIPLCTPVRSTDQITEIRVLPGLSIIPEQNIQSCHYLHAVFNRSKLLSHNRVWNVSNGFLKRVFTEMWKQKLSPQNTIMAEHSNFTTSRKILIKKKIPAGCYETCWNFTVKKNTEWQKLRLNTILSFAVLQESENYF